MLWEPWVIRSLSKDFQKQRLIKKYCFERWATRSPLEVATAAGGSWPKRLFFEEERFIAKCSFGALSDQELFGIVRVAWGCLGRAVALWDVLGRSEALELSGALGRSRVFWCVLGCSEVLLRPSVALSGFPCNQFDTGTTRIVVREAAAEAEADVEAQFVL